MDASQIEYRANEIRVWFMDIEKALDKLVAQNNAAADQAKMQAKVHADGWRLVADSIARGLGDIANAIRDHR